MKLEAEIIAIAAIAATLLGVAAWGTHHKRVADELRGELAACALRASHAEAALDELASEAKKRTEAAERAVEAARKDAQAAQRRADEILKRPAAVPGNDCASAKVRAEAWLKSRAGAAK